MQFKTRKGASALYLAALLVGGIAATNVAAESYSADMNILSYQTNASGTVAYIDVGSTDNLGRTDVTTFEVGQYTLASAGSWRMEAFDMSLQARTQGGGGGGGGFIDPQSVNPVTDALAPGSEKPNTSANEKPKPGSGGELDNPWLIGPLVGMGMCYVNSMLQNAN